MRQRPETSHVRRSTSAHDLHDRYLHGRAALRFAASGAVGFGAEWGVVDQPTVDVLEEGLDAIGPKTVRCAHNCSPGSRPPCTSRTTSTG